MRGIILVASVWIRESLVGVVTELTISPAVVVGGRSRRTRGRELALEIGNSGL